MFFIGIVKTASRCFPKNFLTNWLEANSARQYRGGFKLLETVAEGKHIYALAWSDKKGKQIIFTAGNTLPGPPSERPRHRRIFQNGVWKKQKYVKVVPRPNVVAEMFNAFSTIDIHDHYRQGSLEVERQWRTQDWMLRIFGTILGIIIVNSYHAYLFNSPRHIRINFTEFLGRLSY